MSLLSRALPALRLYCIGLAVALHQLLRRLCPGGPPAPGVYDGSLRFPETINLGVSSGQTSTQ